MSMVPTWVQSREGLWYKNPVIRRRDWFVCWDDDDPIELVVKENGPDVAMVVAELLTQWPVHVRGHARRGGGRRFSSEIGGGFEPAVSCWLGQTEGPPGEWLTEWQILRSSRELINGDCVLYHNGRVG